MNLDLILRTPEPLSIPERTALESRFKGTGLNQIGEVYLRSDNVDGLRRDTDLVLMHLTEEDNVPQIYQLLVSFARQNKLQLWNSWDNNIIDLDNVHTYPPGWVTNTGTFRKRPHTAARQSTFNEILQQFSPKSIGLTAGGGLIIICCCLGVFGLSETASIFAIFGVSMSVWGAFRLWKERIGL
jgi:hypothetical protein